MDANEIAERNKQMLADIASGSRPQLVADRNNISRQWLHTIRKRKTGQTKTLETLPGSEALSVITRGLLIRLGYTSLEKVIADVRSGRLYAGCAFGMGEYRFEEIKRLTDAGEQRKEAGMGALGYWREPEQIPVGTVEWRAPGRGGLQVHVGLVGGLITAKIERNPYRGRGCIVRLDGWMWTSFPPGSAAAKTNLKESPVGWFPTAGAAKQAVADAMALLPEAKMKSKEVDDDSKHE